MGSLQLKQLRNADKIDVGHTFKDLHLDVEQTKVPTKFTNDALPGKDIRASYDIEAINNSLRNIFNTSPGERILVPEFGANLRRYLFASITEATANSIGSAIVRTIEMWEPRVEVDFVNVVGKPELHEYHVKIRLTIIGLKKPVDFNMILNRENSIDISVSGNS